MAICRSGARFDKDSYYETIVDESNEDVKVRGTKNGEPVEYSLGGGGSGDLTYANVKVNFVGEYNPTEFSYTNILIQNDAHDDCVRFDYGSDYGLPLSDLGSVTNIKVPVYKNYKTDLGNLTFAGNGGYLLVNTTECSVVSGDAEIDSDYRLLISGDCELNIALAMAD